MASEALELAKSTQAMMTKFITASSGSTPKASKKPSGTVVAGSVTVNPADKKYGETVDIAYSTKDGDVRTFRLGVAKVRGLMLAVDELAEFVESNE